MVALDNPSLRVAIVGAGWAGMAAAVRAVQLGHQVTVFEAARQLGGRARGLPLTLPDGRQVQVDNGQHILIGAYTDCLQLMRTVGIDPDEALLRLPLTLRFADGSGLQLPRLPAPIDAAAGILAARGWSWGERIALLREAMRWRRAGFSCDARLSVAELCTRLPPRLIREFIEPLCISALNTPLPQASARMFLRVLHDGLFAASGGSNMLLPRTDLSALFPQAAARWTEARGGVVHLGTRIDTLHRQMAHWRLNGRLNGQLFDQVIIATAAPAAVQLLRRSLPADDAPMTEHLQTWCDHATRLQHHAISTVYAQVDAPHAPLRPPALALHSSAAEPAQFVFERDAIALPEREATRLLAFVVSTSRGERSALEAAVVAQARRQLGLTVTPLLTVIEKRATFACTPGLHRPAGAIAPGLWACGDYVDGAYPATLEGAVRSGLQAAQALQ